MIVTRREELTDDIRTRVGASGSVTPVPADDIHPTNDERDENGMTRDDIFNQLAYEDHVVTSGRGSRLPITDSDGGTTPTGYSAGVGSGSGSD